jgi:hypothetical protein
MENVNPPKVNKKVVEAVVTITALSALFYFFFVRPSRARAQSQGEFAPHVPVPLGEEYSDRKEYCSVKDKSQCVRGFDIPDSMEKLNFENGQIQVMVKYDTTLFGSDLGGGMLSFFKKDGKMAYKGSVNGVDGTYLIPYDNLKGKVVLVNKKYLLTND